MPTIDLSSGQPGPTVSAATLRSNLESYDEASLLHDAYVAEHSSGKHRWYVNVNDVAASGPILNAEPRVQIAVLILAVQANNTFGVGNDTSLATVLFRRRLPFSLDDIRLLVEVTASQLNGHFKLYTARAVAAFAAKTGTVEPLRDAILVFRKSIGGRDGDHRKLLVLLDEALGMHLDKPARLGEPFGDAVLATLDAFEVDTRVIWDRLVRYIHGSSASKPTKKWLDTAKSMIDVVGSDEFVSQIGEWLPTFAQLDLSISQHPTRLEWRNYEAKLQLAEYNYAIMKGLAWALRLIDTPQSATLVGDIGAAAYVKTPNHGARSMKVGNAAIGSLGAMAGLAPISQLSRLKRKVVYQQAQVMIDAAMIGAAQREGMTVEDIEELATPTFGVEADGWLREDIGEFQAAAQITSQGVGDTEWTDKNGTITKTPPAEVQRSHAAELSIWRRVQKDINNLLPSLKARVEATLLTQRTWTVTDWRERYFDHPLMGTLAGPLIWHFIRDGAAVQAHWLNGEMVDIKGKTVTWLDDPSVRVKLWHPIASSPDTVLAWRVRLENLGIRQPFKQAHREIYLLTDAELTTDTYSNRFAAHVLKQHQLIQLCRQRGWSYNLQGDFDGGGDNPTWRRPDLGYSAEFWTEPGGDLAESGIFLYVATDQVRFYHAKSADPLPLSDVPATIFTEVMRDVDLIVGVCSVGNDPNWIDGGHGNQYNEYWHSYSFGDLNATAETRRDVLSRLLPRLKIADRCTLESKFLVVKGSMRSYKIHLGSGNILMTPNDQYLCIVPGPRRSKDNDEPVFLPFEGDQTLAVIISKAFMLANDLAIADRTILNQIQKSD